MQSLVALGTNDFSGPIDVRSSCFIRKYQGVTPFCRKLHRVYLDTPIIPNGDIWLEIPKQGDLLTQIYLDLEPATEGLVSNLFQRIEIYTGKNILERLHSQVIDILHQLTVPSQKRDVLKTMYPLPFSFNKIGLPLLALENEKIYIRFVCKNFGTSLLTDASILCNYVFLSEVEREWFKKPYDMLITQVQMHEENVIPSYPFTVNTNFLNPCKELFFTRFDRMAIRLNNIDIVPVSSWKFYHELIPVDFHTRIPDGDYGVYTFSIEPELYEPSGSVNVGTMLHQQFYVEGARSPFRIYAVTYNIVRIQDGRAAILFNNLQ
jgi:hypothetical protein